MEESLTKEQFPQNGSENGALSKEIENHSQMSKNTGLSRETIFLEVEEEAGSWNEWRGSLWAPQACTPPPGGWRWQGLWPPGLAPRPALSPRNFQKFQKNQTKLSGPSKNFYFRGIFSGTLKQKTGKAKLILSFFF